MLNDDVFFDNKKGVVVSVDTYNIGTHYIDFNFEHREIHLKNRPNELYAISPKGTVPVLHLNETTVLNESLDIILSIITPFVLEVFLQRWFIQGLIRTEK